MRFFMQFQKQIQDVLKSGAWNRESQKETFAFTALPENVGQMKSLPEAALDTPFQTAALTVCALCVFAASPEAGAGMLDFLRGSRPLTWLDISCLEEDFRDGRAWIPFSYFAGALPENHYSPDQPYSLAVFSDEYSFDGQGNARLYLTSGGAENPRHVRLKQTGDGKWHLWEQYLLADIRKPEISG